METSESIRPDQGHEASGRDTQRALGSVQRYSVESDVTGSQAFNGDVLLLYCEGGNLAISSVADGILRFTAFFGDEPDLHTTMAIAEDAELPSTSTSTSTSTSASTPSAIQVRPEGDALSLQVSNLEVSIRLVDAACTVTQTDTGFVVAQNMRFYISATADQVMQPELQNSAVNTANPEAVVSGRLECDASPEAHFYGLGEKTGFLSKRGESYAMWNSDVYAPHVPEIEALYVSIPFLISFESGRASGLFVDSPGKSEFDMRQRQNAFEVRTETSGMDAYVIAGPVLKDVVQRYTQLTGRMPLPPKWALGYHQSRYSYMSQAEVLDLAQEFRTKQIPLDAIYLDIHYMHGYRVFTFDETRFPNPKAMLDELSADGIKVVPIVDPGVKQDPQYPVYAEGAADDRFCKLPDGQLFIADVWPGPSAFPDFTDDSVSKWWGEQHKFYTNLGIRGIWNDMNEPAVFNESKTMDGNVIHRNNGRPQTHQQLHNLYGILMSKATYTGLKTQLGGERPFVLTRSGYAGVQRYAAVWTGDNRSFWEHMELAIAMVLNLGLSGVALTGPDVGGFAHHSNGPLLARWTQMGAFFPYFRNHSSLDTIRQEPWAFGDEVEAICRQYIQMRYRWLPYLYSLFAEAASTGLPVMRPLVLEYPDDPETYNLSNQFLVGKDVLVAPILRPDTFHRAVYLPAGVWYDYWTGERYTGQQHILVHAPLDTLPLFVRAGAVIPQGPVLQSTAHTPAHPAVHTSAHQSHQDSLLSSKAGDQQVVFHVYLDRNHTIQPNSFTFYDDDGQTFAYKRGEYLRIYFAVEDNGERVALSCRELYRGSTNRTALSATEKQISTPEHLFAFHGIDEEYTVNGLPRVDLKDFPSAASGWTYDAIEGAVLVKVAQLARGDKIEICRR